MKHDSLEAYRAGREKVQSEFTPEWTTVAIFAVGFAIWKLAERFLATHDTLPSYVNSILSLAVAIPASMGLFAIRRKFRR